MTKNEFRGWEYAKHGDYHRNLDPDWSYTPTYLKKMYHVRQFLDSLPKGARILDAGCGEGVLVEEYLAKGCERENSTLWKDELALSTSYNPFNIKAWCLYMIGHFPPSARPGLIKLYNAVGTIKKSMLSKIRVMLGGVW